MERKRGIEIIIASMFIILILGLILIFGYGDCDSYERVHGWKMDKIHYETESIKILDKNYLYQEEKINYKKAYENSYLIKEYKKELFVSKDHVFIREKNLYEKEGFRSFNHEYYK